MGRVRIETLGCRLNQSEEAMMAGLLAGAGWRVEFGGGGPADAVVIHGCAVTRQAERSTLQAVRAAKRGLPAEEMPAVVVSGCAAGAIPEAELRRAGADIILRRGGCLGVAGALDAFFKSGARPGPPMEDHPGGAFPRPGECAAEPAPDAAGAAPPFFASGAPLFRHGRDRAILKVQDGCDFRCSYCIVPRLRGPGVSRPFAEAVGAAAEAAAAGYREIVVTGCNLACYRDGGMGLPELLSAICAKAAGFGADVSVGSVEPGVCDGALAEVMAANGNFRRFVHLPVQSGDDRVLALAGRRYTSGDIRGIVRGYRAAVEGIAIGADFIAGLPGEDEEAFARTCGLVRELEFAPVHVFPFSPRRGTAAAALAAPPRYVAKRRARELISLTASRSSK